MTDETLRADQAAIALTRVVKRYGTVTALEGADLLVRPGTVHVLLGENGAGKTTLMRVAFGMVRPDGGAVAVRGVPVTWRSPADAIAAGIGMVHQHFTLVPAMTVAENVELGAGTTTGWRFDRRRAEDRVRVLSRESGLAVNPGSRVETLSIAVQQRVEILKALSHDARILILDEPTAVLAPAEIEELLRWLRSYTAAGGTAVLITHKLREALAVADDVTVLRRGRTVFTSGSAAADESTLTRAMIGGEPDVTMRQTMRPASQSARAASTGGEPIAVLEDVFAVSDEPRRESVRASVAIYPGDVVGVAGVEGAGHHTLLRVLAGRIRPTEGRLSLPAAIGFIPEDRHRDGLVLEFTLDENVALRGAGSRRGRIPWSTIRERTATLMRELDIRASTVTTPAQALSGGNQQRLVLARELDGEPALVVAENPTRGLDVRAAAEVHRRLRSASVAGSAVVIYSSDLDEVLTLATRVLAVHAGTVQELAPDKDLVGRAILGAA